MTSISHLYLPAVEALQGLYGHAFALLVEATLKGTLFLLIGAGLALALRRASAASRHLIWTLVLCATLALPVLSLTLPSWKVVSFSSSESVVASKRMRTGGNFEANAVDVQTSPAPGTRQPVRPAPAMWVLLLWGIGAMFCMVRMAVGEVRVRMLADRSRRFQTISASSILENASRRIRVFRFVELRTSTEISIPFTRGVFRPAVILPEASREWPQGQLEIVLAHELAHVYRLDCLTQLLAQIACALLWFHPLIWFAAVQMRQERERACDDVVLSVGHRAADYAEFLLALGRRLQKVNPTWSTTVAMAQPSQLEVRMKALLDSKLNHGPLAKSRVLVAAFLRSRWSYRWPQSALLLRKIQEVFLGPYTIPAALLFPVRV